MLRRDMTCIGARLMNQTVEIFYAEVLAGSVYNAKYLNQDVTVHLAQPLLISRRAEGGQRSEPPDVR